MSLSDLQPTTTNNEVADFCTSTNCYQSCGK